MRLREAIRDLDALSLRTTLFAELVDGHFSPASKVIALELTGARRLADAATARAASAPPGGRATLAATVRRSPLDGRSLAGLNG